MRSRSPTHGLVTTNGDTFDDNRPTLIQVFPSKESATEALSGTDEYPDAEVMHLDEYEELKREWHLDNPGDLTFVDAEEYNHMLEVLPPEHYRTHGSFARFCMREHQTGSITRQYARIDMDGRTVCAWRHVDAEDPDTWITPDELREHAPDVEVV